jgi:hypothetical protein
LQSADTHNDDATAKNKVLTSAAQVRQNSPPDAARQKGNGKNGKNRQHAVKGIQRDRGELSQDNVVTLQIGQE